MLIPTEQTTQIIPDETQTGTLKTPEQQEKFARKAALAAQATGADYKEHYEKYLQMASTGMEQVARDEISNLEFIQRQSIVAQNVQDALQRGADDVVQRELEAFSFQRAREDALERKYVDSLKNDMPADWAELAQKNPDLYESRAKSELFRQAVDRQLAILNVEEEAESFFEEIPDFLKAATALPMFLDDNNFWEGTRADQINKVKKTLQFIKEQPEDQWGQLLNQLTVEINESRAFVDNPQEVIDIYTTALGTERDLDADILFSSMDAAFALGEIAALTKIGKKLVLRNGVLKDADDDVLAAKELAGDEALAEDIVNGTKKYVQDADEAVEQINLFKAPSGAYKTGISEKVKKVVERQEKLLKDTVDNLTAPEYAEQVLAKEATRFEKEYIQRPITGASIDPDTGNFVYRYGTTKGTPFKSETAAQKSIEVNQLQDAVIEQTPHGYEVVVKTKSPDATQAFNELSWVGKNLGNVSDTVKALLPIAQQAEGANNQIQDAVKGLIKNLEPYAGTKKGVPLGRVLERGRKNREWYTPTEFQDEFFALNGRNATPEEELAYVSFRQMNDFSDMLRVKPVLEKSASRGDRVHTIEGTDYQPIGRDVDEGVIFSETSNKQPFVILDGEKIIPYGKNELRSDIDETMQMYKFIELSDLQREDFLARGLTDYPVRYVAIPKSAKPRDITYKDVSNYVAGGRTAHDSPYFVKIALGVDGSQGKYRLNDLTVASASSKKQAAQEGEKLNRLIELMKANKDDLSKLTDEAIEDLGIRYRGLNSVRAADEFMKEYSLYNRAIVAKGVGNREIIRLEEALDAGLQTDDLMTSPVSGKLFGSRTKDGIPHVDGGESDMLDPIEAAIDSLNTAANFSTSSAFRDRALNYMKETMGEYLDTKSSNAYALLTANVSKRYLDDPEFSGVVNAIQAHQKFLANMLAQPTQFENSWANWTDKVFRNVFDRTDRFFGKGGYSRERIKKQENFIQLFGQDPVTKARSLTFHTTLGLYSLPSFIMQMINVVNISALAPKYGTQAAAQSTYLRMALLAQDKNFDDWTAKFWKQAGFNSESEVKDYVEEFRRLGIGHIGNNSVVIAGLDGAQLSGTKWSKFTEHGRMFFDQGELLNRLTAYGAARKKWDNVVGKGRPASSEEGRAWITSETHRLTLGMSRADLQLGLRGNLASIPTQFLSYPLRLASAMAPKMLGGSKSFTNAEKSRLIAANLVMFGGAGVPLGDVVTDYLIQNHNMDSESAKFLSNGLIDGALYAMSDGELDSNFSHRAGTGAFLSQLMRDTGLVGDEAKSLLELFGGAAGSRATGVFTAGDEFISLLGAVTNPNLESVSDATMDLLTEMITSLKTYDRAYTGYSEGYIYSRSGNKLAKITKPEAISIALGLPPQAYENISTGLRNRKQRKEIIKNEVKIIRKLYDKYFKATDPETKQLYKDAISYQFHKYGMDGIAIEVSQQYLSEGGMDDMESWVIQEEKERKLRTPEGADKNYSEQLTKEQ